MPAVEVGSMEISGVTCIIEAQAFKGGGSWYLKDARDNANLGSGATLEQAIQRARVAVAKRKVKVEVKFRTVAGEHGVAHGIHARDRTVLARLNGEPTTLRGTGNREGILKADTPESVIKRWQELEEQRRAAVDAAAAIIDEWGLDLLREVRFAIDERVAEQEDTGASA